jgi:hypothetical protein
MLICSGLGACGNVGRRAARMEKSRVGTGAVHRNYFLASVTIEDGFGFEAVVPVKSPI